MSDFSSSSIEKLEYTHDPLVKFVLGKPTPEKAAKLLFSILEADEDAIEINDDKNAMELIADICQNVKKGNIYIIHDKDNKSYKNNESDKEFKKDLNDLISQLLAMKMLIPYTPPIQATKPIGSTIDSTSNNKPKSWSWFHGGKKTKSKKNKSKKNKSKKNKTRRNRK